MVQFKSYIQVIISTLAISLPNEISIDLCHFSFIVPEREISLWCGIPLSRRDNTPSLTVMLMGRNLTNTSIKHSIRDHPSTIYVINKAKLNQSGKV